MKLEALRRSLVRWLTPAATSVSPQIDRSRGVTGLEISKAQAADTSTIDFDSGQNILKQLRAAGMIPPDAEVRVHHGPIPQLAGVQAVSGIKPPPDPPVESWTWAAWKREIDALALPGWAVCRFANRTGPDNVAFVFGAVRGSFGIWRQPLDVCAAGADRTEHILTCITHLRSGLGIGIFADRQIAAEAAVLADRVCPGWETLDPDDRAAWDEVHIRTGLAWSGIGIGHAEYAHCHDQAGGSYPIYTRSPQSLMAGRPEKLS